QLGEADMLLSFEALSLIAIQDIDPKVRLPAVRALWEYENPDLIPIFLEMVVKDSDADVRAATATALGRYVYLGELDEIPSEDLHEVEERLLEVTRGGDAPLVRRRALESLGFSSREEVQPLIETAYTSGNRDWIASALFAMGRSANEKWQPDVLAMLENSAPAIRVEAARAAGELEIGEARLILLDMLEDTDDSARDAAIWSLSQIGGEGVRETLERIYEETEDDEEADYIEQALDNLAFTEDLELFSVLDVPEEDELDLEDRDELFDSDDDLLDLLDDGGEEEDGEP
ncbi:MAG TPA: HEAT repeat domain-containing protein, partial [Anaerolineales bacterium]